MSIRYSALKQVARGYRNDGWPIRDAVKLAADTAEPYPMTVTPFWQRPPLDKRAGEYRMARHYVPAEFRYQEPDEYIGRTRH